MKIKIILGSLFAVTLLIVIGFFPLVQAGGTNNEKKVTIKTTCHLFSEKKESFIKVSENESLEIKEDLDHLRSALMQGDERSIQYYQSILINKGVLKNKIFSSINKLKNIVNKVSGKSNPSNPNGLCLFTANGKGMILYTLNLLLMPIIEYVAKLMLAMILSIFLAIGIIFLIPILLSLIIALEVSHEIPFKIFQPLMIVQLNQGTCSMNGLGGSQQYSAPYTAYAWGFCGITVNSWVNTTNPDLYVLGFALTAY